MAVFKSCFCHRYYSVGCVCGSTQTCPVTFTLYRGLWRWHSPSLKIQFCFYLFKIPSRALFFFEIVITCNKLLYHSNSSKEKFKLQAYANIDKTQVQYFWTHTLLGNTAEKVMYSVSQSVSHICLVISQIDIVRPGVDPGLPPPLSVKLTKTNLSSGFKSFVKKWKGTAQNCWPAHNIFFPTLSSMHSQFQYFVPSGTQCLLSSMHRSQSPQSMQ